MRSARRPRHDTHADGSFLHRRMRTSHRASRQHPGNRPPTCCGRWRASPCHISEVTELVAGLRGAAVDALAENLIDDPAKT